MRQLKISKSITNRSTKAVDSYLSEISTIGLISKEREVELAKRIKQGDNSALLELVNSNLRFVVSVSKQYQNRGVPLLDLINEGNLGLITAAKRFDETKGFKFISFAVWWIRQAVLESISENGRLIRVPLNKIGLQNKFLTAHSKLEQKLGRYPHDFEVMEEMGLKEKEIKDLLLSMGKVQSYDAPISNDENSDSLLGLLVDSDKDINAPDEHMAMKESSKLDIQRCLSDLPVLEKTILEKYFGLTGKREKTLDEIASEMDYSSERIRQIKEKGLRKLRAFKRARLLQKYLN
jgi:RNA polymerase primary sigma factor